MSLQVEKLEKNMVKLTIEATAQEFEAAVNKAYLKNRNKMNVQGFRKGKAPRVMIEKLYGAEIFFEEAANIIIPDAYEKAAEESGLDIVARPEIDVTQIEKGKTFIFTASVAVKPEVNLGNYKGIEVSKKDREVTEEELTIELDKVRNQNARTLTVEDRPAKDKDETIINFEGFIDGLAFEGGKGENFSLVLGSHSFVDTFEEQLIGKNIGEEVEVNVTFPEDYQAKDLASKRAMFKVTILEIKEKELPELDDDFAQDVSEFETLEEYKADIKAKLTEKKVKEVNRLKEDEVVGKIIENCSMDIPDQMIDTQVRQMAEEFSQRIQSQGLTVEQYFQFTGMDSEKFVESMKPQAIKRIQSRLVLEAIAKAEAIPVSEEDLEKEIASMAAMYQMEVDKLKEILGNKEKEQMKVDIGVQRAVDIVVEASVEV